MNCDFKRKTTTNSKNVTRSKQRSSEITTQAVMYSRNKGDFTEAKL